MRSWYEALARRFTLVRYDQRGAGLSSRSVVSQSIDDLVTDIGSVADAVGANRFVLLGWIAGSMPAIAYAARRPERVSHLALLDPGPSRRLEGASPPGLALLDGGRRLGARRVPRTPPASSRTKYPARWR
jgi:pimeloyl-ACP methyl ester carboxylesterase